MAKSGRKPVPVNTKMFREKMGCKFCDYYEGRTCMFEKYEHRCPFRKDLKDSVKYATFVHVGIDNAVFGQEIMMEKRRANEKNSN